jgi:N4-gp56 family major capsid protein
MTTTNFTRLTTEQKTVWSRDLWKQARNQSFINKFLGDGPNAIIQHITNLTKSERGARAVMTLVPDLEGDGVAGDRALKGNEEQIKAFDRVIRVDQLRNANISEGRMAEQKSIVKFRETSRDVLAYWMADRCDQVAFLTLSGVSYSMKNTGIARVGSDLINLEFAADVAAPTNGRVLRWNGTDKVLTTAGATSQVTAADTPTYNMFVQLKAYAKESYVRGVRDGGAETYHAFLSPKCMAKLKLDPDYLANLRNAGPRSVSSNPLFSGGDAVMLDGIIFHEFRHVFNTSQAVSGAGKWGAGLDIDGCQVLFLGAQAMGMADIGSPTWVEKDDDYENQQGISVAKIFGFLKPKFYTQYGAFPSTDQDFGAISVYVAQ